MATLRSLGASVRPGEDTIYRVACRIFSERGYHATSMRAIASALGMQPAALYYYFPSKEDLLFSIMDTAVDALTERVLAAIDPSAPPPRRLEQAVRTHIITVADHLEELGVFLHELKALGPARRGIVATKRDRYERIFRDILQDGMGTGDFASSNLRLTGFLILSACNWLYNWYRPDGEYTPEQVADSFTDTIMYGLIRP